MGNSTSNNSRQLPPPQTARSRPLKNKKRSIVDHPALLTQRTDPIPIPIPTHTGQLPPRRPTPPQNNDSADYVPDLLHREEQSTHRPIQYNSTRSFGGVRRGAPQGGGYDPVPPPPPFMPEIVRSSIPLRIPQPPSPRRPKHRPKHPGEQDQDDPDDSDDYESQDENEGLAPVTIVWRGGGKHVLVAGTFDPLEWRARKQLRFDPSTNTHATTLHLPPGTYRIKFIVDDAWHCSDDMPTATDDETANLVNYIDVEDASALALGSPAPGTEERQSTEARVMKANRRRTYPARRNTTTTTRSPYHPPLLPPSFWDDLDTDTELEVAGWERGRDGVLEKWSTTIPDPLIAAAHQEEAYVTAVQAQRDARRGGAGTRGALGALGMGVPSIPPAPRLPRHLDKVILNTHKPSAASGSGAGKSGRSGKRRTRSGLGMTSLLAESAPAPETSSAVGMEQWAQADDSSVLPIPSHVVIHHLGTSAIKNGVLAVSDTTRYNKKYVTTIYYKPT